MRQFKLSSAVLSSMLALSPVAAWSQSASAPAKATMPAMADTMFVNKAALGGMTEVKLGELAAGNGQSQSVKDYGKHMVDDHSKANDELAGIAKGKSMMPPAALDTEHQALVDKFTAMKGADFDKAYWRQMLADHKKTIALFKTEAASGKDAELKAFATKTLPTLNMHLKMVQNAMAGKNADKSGGKTEGKMSRTVPHQTSDHGAT